MKKLAILLTLPALWGLPVAAQGDLNKQIDVDRTLQVETATARKLNEWPSMTLAPVEQPQAPAWSGEGVAVVPQPGLVQVSPIDPRVRMPLLPGYARLSLGTPTLAGSLEAGYAIIRRPATRLEANIMAVTDNYKRYDFYNRSNGVRAALNFTHAFSATRILQIGAAYEWQRFNMHDFEMLTEPQRLWQSASMVDVNARWRAGARDAFSYSVGADVRYFGYADTFPGMEKGADTELNVSGMERLALDDNFAVSFRQGVDFVVADGGRGVVTLLPAIEWTRRNVSLTAGPRLDIDVNYLGKAVHVAPAVKFAYTPVAKYFSAEVRAYGGDRSATLSRLSRLDPRLAPWMKKLPVERMPIAAGATLTVGPWRGLALSVMADWADAKQLLMPEDPSEGAWWMASFGTQRLTGWRIGVKARAAVGSVAALKASWMMASNNPGHGWFEWADRPSNVVDASLTLTPLKPLNITVAYELRVDRRIITPDAVEGYRITDLGDASLLSVEAMWQFTPRLSAFVRGNNLLNCNYSYISLTPASGARALLGATLTF